MKGKRVWTRLQAFLLAVILVATSVVTPMASAANAGEAAGAPSRPKLHIDFLGDNRNDHSQISDPTNQQHPADDTWKYSRQEEVGTIFWVGVGIEDAKNLKLGADGSLFSMELGFYYNPAFVEPYTGADGFQRELEKVNLASAPNGHQWDGDAYELTAAVNAADPADPAVLSTIYDNSTQERDEQGNIYTVPAGWKMAYVSLEKKRALSTELPNRFSDDTGLSDREYVMMIPFVLKGIDADKALCFRLARNAAVFTMGGGTDGAQAYAAWERDTASHPEENLKLKFDFTGDLNIFTGQKEQGTFHDAVLKVENGGSQTNNAVLSMANDPMIPPKQVDWNAAMGQTPHGTTVYDHIEADALMQVNVTAATGYVAAVTVTDDMGNGVPVTGNDATYFFAMPAANVTVTVTFTPQADVEYTATLDVTHTGPATDPLNNSAKLVNTVTKEETAEGKDQVKAKANTPIEVQLTLNSDYDARVSLEVAGGSVPKLELSNKSETAQTHSFLIAADTTVKVEFIKAPRYDITLSVNNDPPAAEAAVIDGNTAKLSITDGDKTTVSSSVAKQGAPVTVSAFQRAERTVALTVTHHPGHQVQNIQVFKQGGTELIGDLKNGFVKTTTANTSYAFTMPGEPIQVVVTFAPIQGYIVELTTNADAFAGSTVRVTSDCPTHTADDVLQANGDSFYVFAGNTVTIQAVPGQGRYVSVTAARSDNGQKIYLSPLEVTEGEGYTFVMPLLSAPEAKVIVDVQFSEEPPQQYTAHIDESYEAGAPSHSGNQTIWTNTQTNLDQSVIPETPLQAKVAVAPGYHISAVRVVGAQGIVPFSLSGNGYNNGKGGTETVDLVMPRSDVTVFVVYGKGLPPVEPNYTATLVVDGNGSGEFSLYNAKAGTAYGNGGVLTLRGGDEVTVTMKPDTGSYLTGFDITTSVDGLSVPWRYDAVSGQISFRMPAAHVAVSITVEKSDATTPKYDLTLTADDQTTAGTGALTAGGQTATKDNPKTLSVFAGEVIFFGATPENLNSVALDSKAIASLDLGTGTGSVVMPESNAALTAVWAEKDPGVGQDDHVITFVLADPDNDGTATQTGILTVEGEKLQLESKDSAGASGKLTGAFQPGDTVLISWTPASGYTGGPVMVTSTGGTITPTYLGTNAASFVLPAEPKELVVTLPFARGEAPLYTTNIVIRMEDGSELPPGADAYFEGGKYSLQAPAGENVPFTMVAPDGYYISRAELAPKSLNVPVSITGQFAVQTGAFVMPAADGSQVNVYLAKGWPDEVEQRLVFHHNGSATGGTVTYLDAPVGNGASYSVQGDTPVTFAVTPGTGYQVTVMVTAGGERIAVSEAPSGTYTFAMPMAETHVEIFFFREDPAEGDYSVILQLLGDGGATGSASLTVGNGAAQSIREGESAFARVTTNTNIEISVAPDPGYRLYLLSENGTVVQATEAGGVYTYTHASVTEDILLVAVLAGDQVLPPKMGELTAQLVVNNDVGGENAAALARTSGNNADDTNTMLYHLSQGDGVDVRITVAPGYKVGKVVVLPADSLLTAQQDPAAVNQSYRFGMPGRDVVVYVEFMVDDAAKYDVALRTAWGTTGTGAGRAVYEAGQDTAELSGPQINPAQTAKHGQDAKGQAAAEEEITVTVKPYPGEAGKGAHYVESYAVTNKANEPVPYTMTGPNTLTFVMPASGVDISVSFTDVLKENKVTLHTSGIPAGAQGYAATVAEPQAGYSLTLNANGEDSILAGVGRAVNVSVEKPEGAYIKAVYLMQGNRVLDYTYDPNAVPSSFIMPNGDVDLYVAYAQEAPSPDNYAAVLTVNGPEGEAAGLAGHAILQNKDHVDGTSSDADGRGPVTVQSNGAHGFVNARGGDTMVVTIVVNQGYAIDRVEGSLTTIVATGGANEYTFTMPANSNAGAHVYLKKEDMANPMEVRLHVRHSGAQTENSNAATVSYLSGVTTHALTVDAATADGTLTNVPPTQTIQLVVEPQTGYFVRAAYVVQKTEELIDGATFPVYRLVDLTRALEGATVETPAEEKTAYFTLAGQPVDVFVFYEEAVTKPAEAWYNLVTFATTFDMPAAPNFTADNRVTVGRTGQADVEITSKTEDGTGPAVMTYFYSLKAGEKVTLSPKAAPGYQADQVVYTPPGLGNPVLTGGKWELTMMQQNASAQVVFWQDENITTTHSLTLAVEDLRDSSDSISNTAKLSVDTAVAEVTTTANTGGTPAEKTMEQPVLTGAKVEITVTPGVPASGVPYTALATYTTKNGASSSVVLTENNTGGAVVYTGSLLMPDNDTTVTVTFFPGYPLYLEVGHTEGTQASEGNTVTLEYQPSGGASRSMTGNYLTAPVGGSAFLGVERPPVDVTLSVAPAPGYKVSEVLVQHKDGSPLTVPPDVSGLIDGTATSLTFKMPEKAVLAKVIYTATEKDLKVTMTDRTGTTGLTHTATITAKNPPEPTVLTIDANSPGPVSAVIAKVPCNSEVSAVVRPDPSIAKVQVKAWIRTVENGVETTTPVTVKGPVDGSYTFAFAMPAAGTPELFIDLLSGYTATLKQVDGYTPANNSSTLKATKTDNTLFEGVSADSANTTAELTGLQGGEKMTTTVVKEADAVLRTVMLTTPEGTRHLEGPEETGYPFFMPAEDVTVTTIFDKAQAPDALTYIAAVTKVNHEGDPGNTADIFNTTTVSLAKGEIWAAAHGGDGMKVSFTAAQGYTVRVTAYPVDPLTGAEDRSAPLQILQLGIANSGEAWFVMPEGKNVQVYVDYRAVLNPVDMNVLLVQDGSLPENKVELTPTVGQAFTLAGDVQEPTEGVMSGVAPGTELNLVVSSHASYTVESAVLQLGGVQVPLTLAADGKVTFPMPTEMVTLVVTYSGDYSPRPYDPANGASPAVPADPADGRLVAVNNADHLVVTVPTLLGASALENVPETTAFRFYYSSNTTEMTELVVGTDVEMTGPVFGAYHPGYTGVRFTLRALGTEKGKIFASILDNAGTTDVGGDYMLYVTATPGPGGSGVESGKTQLCVPHYFTLAGTLESYAPNHVSTLTIQEETATEPLTMTVEVQNEGWDLWSQDFAFRSSELADKTFTLTIDKIGNIFYTRTNIVLTTSVATNFTFTLDNGASIALIPGDINGDGLVNTTDRAYLSSVLRDPTADTAVEGSLAYRADLNGDGVVTVADSAILAANLRSSTDSYGNPTGLTTTANFALALAAAPDEALCLCAGGAEGLHEPECPLCEPPPLPLEPAPPAEPPAEPEPPPLPLEPAPPAEPPAEPEPPPLPLEPAPPAEPPAEPETPPEPVPPRPDEPEQGPPCPLPEEETQDFQGEIPLFPAETPEIPTKTPSSTEAALIPENLPETLAISAGIGV